MSSLSQHLRFGCMRGEFLVESVFPLPEMAVSVCQERVKHGIHFQAFSDDRKRKVTDVSCTERKAIRVGRLEIVGNFCLDESGTTLTSGVGAWLGRELYFKVKKDVRADPRRWVYSSHVGRQRMKRSKRRFTRTRTHSMYESGPVGFGSDCLGLTSLWHTTENLTTVGMAMWTPLICHGMKRESP
jgi:hypothetical protein